MENIDNKKKTEKTKVTIYLPDGLLWEMRQAAVMARLSSDTAAVEEAVSSWVGKPGEVAKPSPHPDDKWHNMLADILASGDAEAIDAITYNLRVFHRVKNFQPALKVKAKK